MGETLTEKEQVYDKLDKLREQVRGQAHKIASLRREINLLREAVTGKESAALRKEAAAYRKALSNIVHRLDNGGVDDETLRSIVEHALLLRGLKVRDRRKIKAAYDAGPNQKPFVGP